MNKNILRLLVACIALAAVIATGVAYAQTPLTPIQKGLSRIGAGLAFGLAAAGAGIGVGLAGAAAIGAIIERRDLFAMYLLFIALAEAIAIYGFAMAFILM